MAEEARETTTSSKDNLDKFPGELLDIDDLPVIDQLDESETRGFPSSDYLLVRDNQGRTIAAANIGYMQSERHDPYDIDKLISDVAREMRKRKIKSDFQVDELILKKNAVEKLKKVEVDVEDITGGKGSWDYHFEDEDDENVF